MQVSPGFEKHQFKLKNRLKIFLFGFLFPLLSLYSQNIPRNQGYGLSRNISAHLLSENGLSQNTIHSIIQDSKGFMWFATEDGLNRYDGYNFTVYKNDPQNKNSISDNFIWTIFEDKKGILWIGTNTGGLCSFEREKEIFTSYKNNSSDTNSIGFNNVRSIYEDKYGVLWVGTEGAGLEQFDRDKGIFYHYRNNPENPYSLKNNVVLSIYEDDNNVLWIGHNEGLDRFDRSKKKFTNYSLKPVNSRPGNNPVLSICQDAEGFLTAGTLDGMIRLNKENKDFQNILNNPSYKKNRTDSRINSLIKDREGVLWIGTGSGLYLLPNRSADSQSTTFSDQLSIEFELLPNNNILYLYEDNSGLIWIGTAEEGIYIYNRERNKFKHLSHDSFQPGSLSHNTIRSIFQEQNGTLWIGTLGGGLNMLLPGRNKFIHFKNNPADRYSLTDNSVSAVFKDKFGYLWVGSWNDGLDRTLTPSDKPENFKARFKNYRNHADDANSLSSNLIQAIYEDSDGSLWIGTGTGLNIYDRKNDRFFRFLNNPNDSGSLSDNQVQSCILEDRDGNLWIGTWGGLNRLSNIRRKQALINPSEVRFTRYRYKEQSPDSKNTGLSDNRIISVYEDGSGNLWFGTYGGGLNKLSYSGKNLDNPVFDNFDIEDGLASNIIYGIQGDDKNNIWLSTDNGISLLDSKTGIIRNYNVNDGLQGNQFFWGASFKGKSGELFFGGTNGFNSFYPSELKVNSHVPPVYITNFQIFNKSVSISDEKSPLRNVIELTKEIELSYNQNVFSFEFTALDFTAPDKNRYAYMMEGFDEGWINSGDRRFVTYTNLDPGDYIFKVKGSNSDGVWNEKGTALKIRIMPPVWRTWWFIALAAVFLLSIVSFIVTSRVKNLLAIERLRSKLAADLHDNIGSGLTEISILSEVISKKINNPDGNIKKSLRMISDTSRTLIDSMSDIVWLVNPKRDSLYDLILRLRDTYSELFSYTDISFKSENIKTLEKVSLSMEHRQHLYLIFKEAINNSVTHSGCSEITLEASVKGKRLEMILKDNGKGFCPDETQGGNGLSNIIERAKTIGGEITISSNEGEGTVIRFVGNIV